MHKLLLTAILLLTTMIGTAQSVPVADHEIHLWPNGAPTDNGLSGAEVDYGDHCSNVTDPTLSVYLPEHPNGIAVLACPGGGYVDVWDMHEGKMLADWYNEQGIVYAVLKYRLPNGHKEVPLDDVHQAMRIMRQHNKEWGFEKLGIQGCSAGGHLAAMASTHYSCSDDQPDFQILFYPVITLDPSYTHDGTLYNLLGEKPSRKLIDQYSNEKQVTAQTPPAFILASTDDGLVPVRNSIEYYNALLAHGVEVSMHLYPEGGHGWCWRDSFRFKPQYCNELAAWLHRMAPKRRVLFIGDSITDGGWGRSGGDMRPSAERDEWDKNHVYGHGYVEQTASYFESHFPEDEMQFWNRGISGNTLHQMAQRWQEDCINLRPNVISVLVGTNDVHYYLEQKQQDPDLTFDQQAWEAEYRQLLTHTRDSLPGVELVLCTPFVAKAGWVGDADNYTERERLVTALADIVRRIAQDYRQTTLIEFDSLFNQLRSEHPTSNNSYWIWDGIHPTPAGHHKMSETWIDKARFLYPR